MSNHRIKNLKVTTIKLRRALKDQHSYHRAALHKTKSRYVMKYKRLLQKHSALRREVERKDQRIEQFRRKALAHGFYGMIGDDDELAISLMKAEREG